MACFQRIEIDRRMPKKQSVILADSLIRVTSAVASLAPLYGAGSAMGLDTANLKEANNLKEAKALFEELS